MTEAVVVKFSYTLDGKEFEEQHMEISKASYKGHPDFQFDQFHALSSAVLGHLSTKLGWDGERITKFSMEVVKQAGLRFADDELKDIIEKCLANALAQDVGAIVNLETLFKQAAGKDWYEVEPLQRTTFRTCFQMSVVTNNRKAESGDKILIQGNLKDNYLEYMVTLEAW